MTNVHRALRLLVGTTLMLGAAPALAQNPNFIDTTRQNPSWLSGSDSLNKVMDELIVSLTSAGQLSGGITTYQGCGSSCGERLMAGSPDSSDSQWCTPGDGIGGNENNPGCQEIAPMARQLQPDVCDDLEDDAFVHHNDPNFEGGLLTNNQAEGLAICADGITITAHSDSLGAFGEDAAACTAFHALADTSNAGNNFPNRRVGNLRSAGTLATGYVLTDWRDVLRLVYTGCRNTDGTCAGVPSDPKTVVQRIARCNSAERQEVITNWGTLFQGVTCPQSSGCPGGLRQAYRLDDSSGTSGVFLELLGVAARSTMNLTSRRSLISGTLTHTITPMVANQSFCDGGMQEGIIPTSLGAVSVQYPSGEPLTADGDPIKKNCASEDDLCGPDGKLGVVRAIRSPDVAPMNAYPAHQCARKFTYQQFINTALPVCPDRTAPSAGRCKFPFFESGGFKTFNCMASSSQIDAKAVSGTDGRVYNYVIHATDGEVQYQDGTTKRMPWVASWRQNMANLTTSALFGGKEFVAADLQCTEGDATRNIGCLTSKSKCTVGFAGRASAFNTGTTHHLLNEPAKVNGFEPSNATINAQTYPFTRLLYVNALRGFENIMLDCVDRGGSAAYCNDQVRITNELYNVGQPGNLTAGLCSSGGYVPLDAAICVGASSSAGCGAPTSQVKTDCLPDTRPFSSLTNR